MLINFRATAESIWKNHEAKIFRTSALHYIDQNMIPEILSVNIAAHIDLRTREECQQRPFPNIATLQCQSYKNYELNDFGLHFKNCLIPTELDYVKYYTDLIHSNISNIILIFKEIAHTTADSFLFSCYAGKDRTGIICALLLTILNVDKNIIFADYKKSGDYLLPFSDWFESNWKKRNLQEQQYLCRLSTKTETIEAVFTYFDDEFGGLIDFLIRHRLSMFDIHKIKKKFLPYMKDC